MDFNQSKISIYWRIGLALFVAFLLLEILIIASDFREPPEFSWVSLLLLGNTYLCLESVIWTQNRLDLQLNWSPEVLNKALSFLLSIVVGTLVFFVLFYGFKWLDHWIDHSEIPGRAHLFLATFLGLAMSTLFASIQTAIQWRVQFYEKHFKNEQLKKQLAYSQLNLLKNQLDPHFMFNSFNTLYYLIDENKELAKNFLSSIANIYRYILQNNDRPLIASEQEYQIASQYLSIMQQRFGKALQVKDLTNRKHLVNTQLPPLVLQQLLENVFKHNRIDDQAILTLSLRTDEHFFYVKNNLNPKRPEFSNKSGLQHMIQQYQLLTKKSVSILKDKKSFEVVLPLIH
jgi:sensor histidine kinase YesM